MPTFIARLFQRPLKLAAVAFIASLMFIATTVMAFSGRSTALGYWKTIDDETGEVKSIV